MEARTVVHNDLFADLGAGVFVVAAVVALDQFSKNAASAHVGADLHNSGLLLGVGAGGRLAVIALSCTVVAIFLATILRTTAQIGSSIIGPMLVVGGMLGNLLDRVRLGSVRDFIQAGPLVINVADVAVATGIVLTIVGVALRVWQLHHNGKVLALDRHNLRFIVLDRATATA